MNKQTHSLSVIRYNDNALITPFEGLDAGPDKSPSSLQVLDEADRILDMGFSATLDAILQNLPGDRQTLLFSATQTKSVKVRLLTKWGCVHIEVRLPSCRWGTPLVDWASRCTLTGLSVALWVLIHRADSMSSLILIVISLVIPMVSINQSLICALVHTAP